MEMLCPECMAPLATDGQVARCMRHGGQYRILFSRLPASSAGAIEPPQALEPLKAGTDAAPGELALPMAVITCARHRNVQAVTRCNNCGTPMCATCDFTFPGGVHLCPDCATAPGARVGGFAVPVTPSLEPGVMCVTHPNVQAVVRCKTCGAAVCATCEFSFPGGIHLCPRCATAPKKALSGRRKTLVGVAYTFAVVATLGFVGMVMYAAGGVHSRGDAEVVGQMILFFVMLPSFIGLIVGACAFEKRLGNTAAVWGAVVWNGLVLAVIVCLAIVGNAL